MRSTVWDNLTYKTKAIFLISLLLAISIASAEISGSQVNYTYFEQDGDNPLYFNFSKNITLTGSEELYEYDPYKIEPISGYPITLNGVQMTLFNISRWISINGTTGIVKINSTTDNQTGVLKLPLAVYLKGETGEYVIPDTFRRIYTFLINATNDAPNWTNYNSTMNFPLPIGGNQIIYLNVSDEEDHFPINFSIIWNDTCYHAPWLNYADNENCDLFNISSFNNNTGKIDFSPGEEMVGEYNATIYITEGGPHDCPFPPYCDENYTQNITVEYPISVSVLSPLTINVSNCSSKTFIEGVEDECVIYVRTRGREDTLSINKIFNFTDSRANSYYSAWGTGVQSVWKELLNSSSYNSVNNEANLTIRFIPNKRQIGDWNVSLKIDDITSNETKNGNFIIKVDRDELLNDVPKVVPTTLRFKNNYTVGDIKIASGVLYSFDFNVSDEDFSVLDKWNGFNETVTVNLTIKNKTTGLVTNILDNNWNYTVKYPDIGSKSPNISNLTLNIGTDNNQGIGDYIINASFCDAIGACDYINFNLSILDDTAPYWKNVTYNYLDWVVNSTKETTTNGIVNLNLTNKQYYAWDDDLEDIVHEDELSFTVIGEAPPNFNLTEDGILNFIPWKEDVSERLGGNNRWRFMIQVCDAYSRCNNSIWTFAISNINSKPSINLQSITNSSNLTNDGGNYTYFVNQSDFVNFTLRVYDEDLAIPNTTEKLNLTKEILNLTDVNKTFDLNFSELNKGKNYTDFVAQLYVDYDNVGNYTINLNVNDSQEESGAYSFNITLLHRNELPILLNVTNISVSVLDEHFVYNFRTYDREDCYYNVSVEDCNLTYNLKVIDDIYHPDIGSPLFFNESTGILNYNFSAFNQSGGTYKYGINVSDSSNGSDYEEFYLFVYGFPEIIHPLPSHTFSLTEGVENISNFTFSYGVNNSNLTYGLYMNRIFVERENNETCIGSNICYFTGNYTLRDSDNITMDNYTKNISITLPVKYYDESFMESTTGLALLIYNEEYPDIVSNVNWSTNVAHMNENITFYQNIGLDGDIVSNANTEFIMDLSDYFSDYDYFDEYYLQHVNFSISDGINRPKDWRGISASDFNIDSNWLVRFKFINPGTYSVKIKGYEWDMFDGIASAGFLNNGELYRSVESNEFRIQILDPAEVKKPSTGGSGGTSKSQLAQHYGLKIITPRNIKISDEHFVELNFSILNTGNVDLIGINLSGIIELDSQLTSDIELTLSDNWVERLNVGEARNYSLKFNVNTEAVGKYLITIFGNVTSPKFYDWGEFYIEVLGMDEDDIAQMLVFTEKFISENPECIELTEYVTKAKKIFDSGDVLESQKAMRQIINACEESITKNEQIRKSLELPSTFTFISFMIYLGVLVVTTISLFILLNRRIKFKKMTNEEYL